MSAYRSVSAIDPDVVTECAECADCGSPDGMSHTADLIDSLDRKCGEVWTCTACGAENIDEW